MIDIIQISGVPDVDNQMGSREAHTIALDKMIQSSFLRGKRDYGCIRLYALVLVGFALEHVRGRPQSGKSDVVTRHRRLSYQ